MDPRVLRVKGRVVSRVRTLLVPALFAAATVTACRRPGNVYVPPPPPEVTVAPPERRTLPLTLDLTGTTRGVAAVEIRARVRGFVEAKHVEDGQAVESGQLLFTIDPREFAAAVAQAAADLEARKAALRLAELALERTRQAQEQQAATQHEVDRALAERDGAEAQVHLAEAKLTQARLDLEFTEVRAPIPGRLSLRTVEVGQLVGAGEATVMGSIVDDSTIYATYNIDERTVLTLYHGHEQKRPGERGRPGLTVLLGMADETGYPHIGQFDKAGNTVDPDTGTIAVEAVFPNEDHAILPGLFVRIRVLYEEQEDALLVPDTSVLSDQRGHFVLVVGHDDIVERRDVTVGPVFERMRPIKEGLEPTARVIVNGIQRARPGAAVKPISAVAAPPPE